METIKQLYGIDTLLLSELMAYRKYQVSVSAFTQIGEGDRVTVDFTTKSATPSSPLKVTATAISSEAIYIEWNFPLYPRGIIRGYSISLSESNKFPITKISYYKDIKLSTQNYKGSINVTSTELTPYTAYYVKVQVYAYEDEPKEIRFGEEAIIGPVYTLQSGKISLLLPNSACPIQWVHKYPPPQ